MTFCCERFANEVGAYKDPVGGGYLYPMALRPSGQIEYRPADEGGACKGAWNVNGCCGGGCYVLDDIKFCPFCGSQLLPP